MVCVRRCCLCIPLEPACYVIGLYYIVYHLIFLVQYVEEYNRFKERGKKDEDNEYYIFLISRIVFMVLEMLLGVLIVIFTCKKLEVGLKLCACAIGLSALIYFIARLVTPSLGQPILLYALYLVIFLYLAIVVYSFGMYIEEGSAEDIFFYLSQPQERNPWSGYPQQQPQRVPSPQTQQNVG